MHIVLHGYIKYLYFVRLCFTHFHFKENPVHSQEADTDENQGSLTFEEFCTFYKLISTRRDLYLLMITYSNHKEHMELNDLQRFLENEQKAGVIHFAHLHQVIF